MFICWVAFRRCLIVGDDDFHDVGNNIAFVVIPLNPTYVAQQVPLGYD